MKKTLKLVAAVFAVNMIAGSAFAGGMVAPPVEECDAECQKAKDQAMSEQAQQEEAVVAPEPVVQEEPVAQEEPSYDPWYVKGIGKMTMFPDIDSNLGTITTEDLGYGGGLAVGKFFGPFRAELEADCNTIDLDPDGNAKIQALTLNGIYDIPLVDSLSLYLLGGAGVANVVVDALGVDDNETAFAYRAGIGTAYSFAANQAVEMGYEYIGTEDVTINNVDFDGLDTHNLVLAYRYSF